MSMGMEVGVFLAYAFGVLMVYALGRFLLVPLKWIAVCIVSSAAGGAAIIFLNMLCGTLGYFIPLNIFTAGIAGLLGVPGIIMLTVFFI